MGHVSIIYWAHILTQTDSKQEAHWGSYMACLEVILV